MFRIRMRKHGTDALRARQKKGKKEERWRSKTGEREGEGEIFFFEECLVHFFSGRVSMKFLSIIRVFDHILLIEAYECAN